ncbi:MAG: asparaginase [Mariniblastus sp.]
MKKICVINTGGTLSMRPSDKGYVPSAGYLAEQMAQMDELSQSPMPAFEVIEHDPLVDSSNMTTEIWRNIAKEIEANYSQYDGFVVLHGTDTMAYTASALAFMLHGLSKPVIFTGAQLPLGQIRNDARENLKTAMMLAANYTIPEVSLFFGDHLFRGCRSTKVSATKFDAFDSPNYPSLASVGTAIEIFDEHILPRETNSAENKSLDRAHRVTNENQLTVKPIETAEIAAFRLFPGLSVDILRHFLQRPLKGIILETYGDGNGPTNDLSFINALREASDSGMVILGCTQCIHGGMTQTGYATGTALTRAGVIPGRDMTIEASLTKMMFLFSQKLPVDDIKSLLAKNLVGELTLDGG